MSAQGVFTPHTRVTLIRGWLTGGTDPADGSVECGDGTLYPLEITSLDQAAEIWVRVKDAHLIGGDYLLVDTGTFPEIYRGVVAPTGAWSDRAYSESSSLVTRGYTTRSSGVSAHDAAFVGSGYPSDPLNVLSTEYKDISDNERGMWIRASSFTPWNTAEVEGVRNAFSFNQSVAGPPAGIYHFAFYNESATIPAPTPPATYYDSLSPTTGAPADVVWYPYVAVVDDGMTVRYFMGLQFTAYPVTTNKNWTDLYATGTELSIKFKVELAGGVVLQCPLYSDPGPDETELSSSDFVFSAVEWWPYNRLAEPVQIWESATGEKIPAGAPFAAMDLDNSDLTLLFF